MPSARGAVESDDVLVHDVARPRRHHEHAIGEYQRLFDVVRHEEHRATVGCPHLLQPLVHLAPGDRVEGTERFVEQQHRPRHQERAQQARPVAACPPDSVAGQARSNPASPKRSNRSSAMRCALGRGERRRSRRRASRSPSTRRHGSSRSRCGWYATSPGFPFATSPPTRASPAVGTVSPARMRSNVDLPHPLGPTIATSSPAAIIDVDARERLDRHLAFEAMRDPAQDDHHDGSTPRSVPAVATLSSHGR